jgi:hypothetical protein
VLSIQRAEMVKSREEIELDRGSNERQGREGEKKGGMDRM